MTNLKLTPYAEPGSLRARMADLADAEARYWATLEEPDAREGDRLEAAENLDRAQTLMQELTTSPAAEPEAEAEMF